MSALQLQSQTLQTHASFVTSAPRRNKIKVNRSCCTLRMQLLEDAYHQALAQLLVALTGGDMAYPV
jgi:hypothetical protein